METVSSIHPEKMRTATLDTSDGDPLLALYLGDIADSPLLSPGQEAELAARSRTGDTWARNALVKANLRFVVTVAKEYQRRGLSLNELISAGNVGLITAAERFDESKGYRFISYAVWWIRQSILRALREQSTVRLPVNRVDAQSKIARAYQRLQQEEDCPSREQVADHLGYSEEKVEQTLLEMQPVHSLDAPFNREESLCMLDCLPDEESSPEEQLVQESLREGIDHLLSGLHPREAQVLRLYFGLGEEPPLTFEQIGQMLKLTRERVRQIKEIALRKLRRNHFFVQLRHDAQG